MIKAKVTYPTTLIKYATKLAKLGCTLFSLQKLKGMDANGLSDSYCRISIVPPLGRNVRYLFIDTLMVAKLTYFFYLLTSGPELAQDKDSGQEHKPSLQRQPPFSRSEI